MIFAMFLTALVAVMLFAPTTQIARWLHCHLVEEPLRMTARFERKHTLFLFVGLIALQGFAMALPAEMAILMAWDVTVYIDLLIAGWTMSAFARFRSTKVRIGLQARRFMPRRARVRARRLGRAAERRRAANDDDPARFAMPLAA